MRSRDTPWHNSLLRFRLTASGLQCVRLFSMLLLAIVSTGAVAGWIIIGSNETATTYADPVTIRKTGDKTNISILYDEKTVRTDASDKLYMSTMAEYEFNCMKKEYQILYASSHSGDMAGGEVISSDTFPSNWMPVPSGSVTESLWNIACGRGRQL